MTILVFGKTGQVAQELSRLAPVTSLGRQDADLCDPSACADAIAAHAPSVVINAAAYTAVDRAEEEQDIAHAVNCEAPAAMAMKCSELGIPFLHISTDYVFDGSGSQPRGEDEATAPLNAYGQTKLLGEQAVSRAGGEYAILRTSWVFSAHGNNFLKTMVRLGKERDELSIVGDQFGGPTPANDIAKALLEMARKFVDSQGQKGTYHFTGAPDVSWAQFAEAIFDASGITTTVRSIPTEDYPTPAARPRNSRLDCSKIKREFGIDQPDWRIGMKNILSEMKVV